MTQLQKDRLKSVLTNSLLAVSVFFIFDTLRGYEVIRQNIGDFGYDKAIKVFSILPSDIFFQKYFLSYNAQTNIIVITIDEDYLKNHNLDDGNGELRYNYTPRFIFANILSDLNKTIKNQDSLDGKPSAVYIDYRFSYPGNMDGTTSLDDEKLINALKIYSKEFTILLPTGIQPIFLEETLKNENVHFVSDEIGCESDGVHRFIKPYICRENVPIHNVAMKLSKHTLLPNEIQCPKTPTIDEAYFRYRILFKDYTNKQSNWKNIFVYSADEIVGAGVDLNNSIVLIGASYANKKDAQQTPIGEMSGVLIIANAIASQHLTGGKIAHLNKWLSAIIYVLTFATTSYYTPPALKLFKIYSKEISYLLGLLISAAILFIISIALLSYLQHWINWVIPWIIYQLFDGKTLIKSIIEKIMAWFKYMK